MNGKNLNVRYRRNTYAKTRLKVILAIVGGIVAILLVLFLVIGSSLKNKVDDNNKNDAPATEDNATEMNVRKEVRQVNGYGLSLLGLSTSGAYDKALEVSKADGNNISFVVRDNAGKELYKSALATDMGKQSSSTQYIDVTDIASRAKNRSLSASAIVPVYSFSKKDDIQRASQLFYDASICAELYREGASDVLVKLEGTKISDKNIDELLRLAEWVDDLDDEVVLGITVTRELIEAEDAEVIISKLWESFDFIALDLTDLKSAEELSQNSESDEMQFYLLMYKMRVLLPDLSGEEIESIVTSLNAMNVDNWQTVVS